MKHLVGSRHMLNHIVPGNKCYNVVYNHNMNNVIIFGRNGMLGEYMYHYLSSNMHGNYNVIGLTRHELDIYNITFGKLYAFLRGYRLQNSMVINCIGTIPQAGDSRDDKYIFINSIFPKMLSICCKLLKWKIIQPATDCVYDGKLETGKAYDELSPNDTESIYGLSKGFGDNLDYGMVLRTSIIGEQFNNGKYSLIEWVKSEGGNTITGYTNHYWNGITCLQYAKIVDDIITNNRYKNGIYHLYSTTVTKHNLLVMINKLLGLNITILDHVTPTSCNRLLSSMHGLCEELCIPGISDQLVELFDYGHMILASQETSVNA